MQNVLDLQKFAKIKGVWLELTYLSETDKWFGKVIGPSTHKFWADGMQLTDLVQSMQFHIRTLKDVFHQQEPEVLEQPELSAEPQDAVYTGDVWADDKNYAMDPDQDPPKKSFY